jgi:hypothetical protein
MTKMGADSAMWARDGVPCKRTSCGRELIGGVGETIVGPGFFIHYEYLGRSQESNIRRQHA